MHRLAGVALFTFLFAFRAVAANPPNGISVGEPKVFDNRTLTIMLESLSQTLQTIQTQSIDQKALAAAVANIQGTRSSDVTSAISIGARPLPSRNVETIEQSGNATSAGTLLPDSLKTTTTTHTDAFNLAAPTLAAAAGPTFSGFTPAFGTSASDLLSDQVNLSYQIFNLRMILERSLSDRLIGNAPRMQGVLGFNVTIDPPLTAVDAVAEVEIELHSEDDVSLVAMMPQEKTYNAATLSTKSNAFGGTAVVNMIPVGAATRRNSQIFYLYRDNDTIAYERTNDDTPGKLVFGWVFRPVLGRRSVSPGFRQLFAVVALPRPDVCSTEMLKDGGCPESKLWAKVTTRWKKYDGSTLTSFAENDANRLTRFRYAATLGLGKPEIFEERYVNTRNYRNIAVKTTAAYESELQPKLEEVRWTPIGTKNVMISITGSRFYTGTQLVLADKTYGPADGLILKSSNAMELIAPIDALTSGSAFISGRYGAAIPLVSKQPEKPGIVLADLVLSDSHAGSRMGQLLLTAGDGRSRLRTRDLPTYGDPIISINGAPVPGPYVLDDVTGGVLIRVPVPDSLLSSGISVAKVSWPFLGNQWSSTSRFVEPRTNYEIVRIGAKSFILRSKETGIGFVKQVSGDSVVPLGPHECWQLFIGDKPFALDNNVCRKADKQSRAISDFAILVTPTAAVPDKVALAAPSGTVFFLDIPKVSQPPTPEKPLTVTQFDAVVVDLTVDDALQVASVEANQMPLRFAPKSPKKGETVINVQLTRDLTAKPGSVDISVVDKSGKTTRKRLLIEPCAACQTNKG